MDILQNYINGAWISEEITFESISPIDNTKIYHIPQTSEESIENAVQEALRAFAIWSNLKISERTQYLLNFAEILNSDNQLKKEVIETIIADVGKPKIEAETEVVEVIDIISYYSTIAEKILSKNKNNIDINVWPNKESYTVYEPYGVVGIIKPWNYPFSNPLWAIIPALIAGNTIVFKPSEYSSKTGLCISKIFNSINLPKGVFNTICGDGRVGKKIVSHESVDFIGFTGSVAVGRDIQQVCVNRGKSFSLELGGNDAAIVLDDANISMAVNGIRWGGFTNAGQVCTGIKRVFVHEEVSRDFIEKIIKMTKKLRPNKEIGPVIRPKEAEKIVRYIEDAKKKGGENSNWWKN